MAYKCFCKSSKKVHNQYISVFYFCALEKKSKNSQRAGSFFLPPPPPAFDNLWKNKKFTLRLKLCMPSFCLELIFMTEL